MKLTVFFDKRVGYYDVLRIMAAFAVVITHVSSQNWYCTDVNSLEWNIFNAYGGLVRWANPIFTMISGALFLNGNQNIKKIFSKNIFRIITAFSFWSFVYAVLGYIQGGGIKNFIVSIFLGHYHMGFLFMIVGLYLLIPFLRKIVESDYLTKYFLILALTFNFIIPQSLFCLSFFQEQIVFIINSMLDKINFHFALGFSLYFVCGGYLSRINIKKKVERIIYILGVCGFVTTILFSAIVSHHLQIANTAFHSSLTLNVWFESVAVFVFIKKHCTLNNTSDKLKFLIQILAKYSFGAYLVHALGTVNK